MKHDESELFFTVLNVFWADILISFDLTQIKVLPDLLFHESQTQ